MRPAATPKFIEQVRTAWSTVLQRNDIADDANFFQLGGDSMQATRIVLAVFATTGVEVTLSDLYDHPTLFGFAVFVSHK